MTHDWHHASDGKCFSNILQEINIGEQRGGEGREGKERREEYSGWSVCCTSNRHEAQIWAYSTAKNDPWAPLSLKTKQKKTSLGKISQQNTKFKNTNKFKYIKYKNSTKHQKNPTSWQNWVYYRNKEWYNICKSNNVTH